MILKHLISGLFLFIFTFSLPAQELARQSTEKTRPENPKDKDNVNIPKLMERGNKLLVDNDFDDALKVWQRVLEQQPHHANANFKAGLCYRNSFDEQTKALPYFKQAVQQIAKEYDFTSETEQGAPYDAMYFLGEAYLANNKPDSALNYFMKYRDYFNGEPPINVDRKIFMSINAKRNINRPRDVRIIQMGGGVNTNFPETHPVLTIDNSIMLFSSRRPREDGSNKDLVDRSTGEYYEDIYIVKRGEDGKFREPGLFKLTDKGNEAPLCFSADGTVLYLRKKVKDHYDLYKSTFEDGVWTSPEPLSSVNSPFDETDMSISGKGKYLYFSSNRPGGKGKFDIYRCVKKSNGKWSKPENLGTDINTEYNEKYPFIHPNGKTLFFSSDGYSTCMGGLDIYFSSLDEANQWSQPQNIGYPINTTRDDINYFIVEGGIRYYARLDEDQSYDLYQIQGGGYPVENISAGKDVVTLTQEMNVTEVMEVTKEVEKEVEVVQTVEKEVTKEKEVEVVDLSALDELEQSMRQKATARAEAKAKQVRAEAEKAKAEAQKVMAEAEKKKAEAEMKKAEADKAVAKKAEALATVTKEKAEMEKSAAQEAEALLKKAKADSAKAAQALEEAKLAFEEQCAKVQIAEAEAKKALKEAEKVAAEKVKKEAEKAEAEKEKAQAEQKQSEAEAEKAVAEAKKKAKQAEVEANQSITKAEETAQKQVEAEKKKAQKAIEEAKAERAKAVVKQQEEKSKALEAAKAKIEAARKKAEAYTKTVEEKKAILQLVIEHQARLDTLDLTLNVENIENQVKKAELEAQEAQSEVKKAKTDLEQLKTELEKMKQGTEQAKEKAEQKAAEARKAEAEAIAKAKESAKAKAEQEKAEAQEAIEQAKAEQEKALAKKEKARAEAAEARAKEAKENRKAAEAELEKIEKQREMAEEQENIAIAEAIKKKAEAIKAAQENIKKSNESAIKKAEAAKAENEKELAELEKELEQLQVKVKSSERQIKQADLQIKEAQARIKKAEAEKKKAEAKIAKYKAENN